MRIIIIDVVCRHQLHTCCMPKHLVVYQTSINGKKKATQINFADTAGFALTLCDFFGGLSEKTVSSIKGENTTIQLYILSIYYINSYINFALTSIILLFILCFVFILVVSRIHVFLNLKMNEG